jgi:hypothetical protein
MDCCSIGVISLFGTVCLIGICSICCECPSVNKNSVRPRAAPPEYSFIHMPPIYQEIAPPLPLFDFTPPPLYKTIKPLPVKLP